LLVFLNVKNQRNLEKSWKNLEKIGEKILQEKFLQISQKI